MIWVNCYVYSTELFTPQWRYIFIGLFEIPIGKDKSNVGLILTLLYTSRQAEQAEHADLSNKNLISYSDEERRFMYKID